MLSMSLADASSIVTTLDASAQPPLNGSYSRNSTAFLSSDDMHLCTADPALCHGQSNVHVPLAGSVAAAPRPRAMHCSPSTRRSGYRRTVGPTGLPHWSRSTSVWTKVCSPASSFLRPMEHISNDCCASWPYKLSMRQETVKLQWPVTKWMPDRSRRIELFLESKMVTADESETSMRCAPLAASRTDR
ncbi:hypothetical protein CRV24_005832 [Beauveria bassiana]|nr:hypothetical protein CRV24_005832 [Beauveria bassiana]